MHEHAWLGISGQTTELHTQAAPTPSMSSHEINWRVRQIERGLKQERERRGSTNEGDLLRQCRPSAIMGHI